ncbi:enoyl-CoA hydratase/isomerase family protein [Rhodococcus pseudokoreensis]|uniref:Enoyl-CoA hydratase/isomerase family protein n=1 Tax=Rhodococcus pseudokoreensis TaxID=2811421 RepID=A0A974W3K0_9NOCA|nr:enoyl-CoA hydratase-related protein [Rhodococcus pseudokoreensis]QSE90688.1 enoyl-CoA hydratase/isomerase family protein [Rhodococcus pseudokoreensis]
MADIDYAVADHIATITLNRPQRKNAFTLEMIDTWANALIEAEHDPNVRVVVLIGAGGSFCSGVDLAVLDTIEPTPLGAKNLLTRHVHKVAHAADALNKPYLAAVSGDAFGAGMDMALLADIRLASESARFSQAYIRVGLVPGDGGCYLLPRIVGTATALQLMWTGRVVGAQEALSLGLVSAVHPDDELEKEVLELATQIARQPPVAVQMIKRSTRLGEKHDLRTALDLISSHHAVVMSTEDSHEARRAMVEKRPAHYVGR